MSDDLIGILGTALFETLYMTALASFFGLLLGLPMAVALVMTDRGHVLESQKFHKILAFIINTTRSFPSIILIVVLLPLARWIVGTSLGMNAALVPLSIGAAPFMARVFETSLNDVPYGKIEAALALGASPWTIVTKVLLPEAMPSLIRGLTVSIIAVLGLTAIAGTIGAGGLGSLAIRYGYQRFREDVMISTTALLVVLVQCIQWSGDRLANNLSSKRT
jgi:D-methionine transport system permease protein